MCESLEFAEPDIASFESVNEPIPKRKGQFKPDRKRLTNPDHKQKRNQALGPQIYKIANGQTMREEHSREQLIEVMEKASYETGYYDSKVPTEKLLFFVF